MSNLNFTSQGANSLRSQFSLPFKQISLKTGQHSRPISAIFWRFDGTGLQIRSVMHDIAERREVGVLDFEDITMAGEANLLVDLPPSFESGIRVSKLLICESGTTAESGVVLTAGDGHEIVIVAGANPYSLAVAGAFQLPHVFEPEYPLEAYTRRTLL